MIGKRFKRLDGPAKSTGRAKYSSDTRPKDLLFGAYLTKPARARPRDEHRYQRSREDAGREGRPRGRADAGNRDAVSGLGSRRRSGDHRRGRPRGARKIKVEYEVLPHFVKDEDLARRGRARQAGRRARDGRPRQGVPGSRGGLRRPIRHSSGHHSCLEPHGQIIQWRPGRRPTMPATRSWSGPRPRTSPAYAGDLGTRLKVPANNIKVKMDYIGGGFGSKFNPDAWAIMGAELSKKAGGRPVHLYLDRATEQMIGGNRPSAYSKSRSVAKRTARLRRLKRLRGARAASPR